MTTIPTIPTTKYFIVQDQDEWEWGFHDQMRGNPGASLDGSSGQARVHGVLLSDPGSCEIPEDAGTITYEEWTRQNRQHN